MLDAPEGGGPQPTYKITGRPKDDVKSRDPREKVAGIKTIRENIKQEQHQKDLASLLTPAPTTKTVESPAEKAARTRSNLGQTIRDAGAIRKRGKEDESKLYQTTEELSIQADKQAFDAAGGKQALNTADNKVEQALLNVQAAEAGKNWSTANKKNYANLMAQLAAVQAEHQNLMDLSYYSHSSGTEDWGGQMSTDADGAAGFGMGMY